MTSGDSASSSTRFRPLNHGHAAIHMQGLAGYIRSFITGQIYARAGNVVHGSHPASRNSGVQLLFLLVGQNIGQDIKWLGLEEVRLSFFPRSLNCVIPDNSNHGDLEKPVVGSDVSYVRWYQSVFCRSKTILHHLGQRLCENR